MVPLGGKVTGSLEILLGAVLGLIVAKLPLRLMVKALLIVVIGLIGVMCFRHLQQGIAGLLMAGLVVGFLLGAADNWRQAD